MKNTSLKVVLARDAKQVGKNYRKQGINHNRTESVRKINGQVYVDFKYFNERVRETSGLAWTDQNAKQVRSQLDKILMAIKTGTFRFSEVFPESRHKDFFLNKESEAYGQNQNPNEIYCKDYFEDWFGLLKSSGRVTERILLGYKSMIDLYWPLFSRK
ncbi:MAG: DUF3596 domain-containing protein [Thermodesulfobacteriota bacterium]|jgi:integrase